jgi:predicted DsbA family dithiol-disulfide isomerase
MTTIEVYADIWCPFAHVGIRRVIERRDSIGADARLRVRPWPLELINGRPLDAAFIGEEVVEIRDQVAPDLFASFDERAFPTSTLPALALAEAAYDIGLDVGEQMSLALRDAVFEQARNIGDERVLAEIGTELGVPPATEAHLAAITTTWDEGKQRGVVGSPHFFTPDGAFFCPALDIARVDGHLRMSPKAGMFDDFIATCFGQA